MRCLKHTVGRGRVRGAALLRAFFGASLLVSGLLTACGGGGGGGGALPLPVAAPAVNPAPPDPVVPAPTPVAAVGNVVPVYVNGGLSGRYLDGLFASVTVCQPGTAHCQTIDHVLVDTGSYGLRVVASAFDGSLLASLPAQTGAINDSAGGTNPLAECALFSASYTWGSVRRADVKLAGESAENLPIQIVGDTASVGPVPSGCQDAGGNSLNTTAELNANGILGIGVMTNDCPACAKAVLSPAYYYCTQSGNCSPARVPAPLQVANPVARFAVNNNGVILTLPPVAAAGQSNAAGSLVFGVGTQDNNAFVARHLLATDSVGNFRTVFGDKTYGNSFIDSGSNGLFFPSTSLPVCGLWYCPTSTLSFSATMQDAAGLNASVVNFDIANFSAQAKSGNLAFNNIGGQFDGEFDWGLPFFFGRTVYTVMSGGKVTGTPTSGPFVAF